MQPQLSEIEVLSSSTSFPVSASFLDCTECCACSSAGFSKAQKPSWIASQNLVASSAMLSASVSRSQTLFAFLRNDLRDLLRFLQRLAHLLFSKTSHSKTSKHETCIDRSLKDAEEQHLHISCVYDSASQTGMGNQVPALCGFISLPVVSGFPYTGFIEPPPITWDLINTNRYHLLN